MALQIGKHKLTNKLFLAPMAGVTDLPFRKLCKQLSAGMATSEMVSANSLLWGSDKTKQRANHEGEPEPKSVQIVGYCPDMMAEAAIYNEAKGADIIDINMGCPAKKICNTYAGSALMKDEALVARLLTAVVNSVKIPVTLKIRTGWDTANRNAVSIAKIAEDCGIQLLAIHGRTRACKYKGEAEYDTIKTVKASVGLPIIANGDITTPEKAKQVLEYTGADGIMIGRAAQGRPWIFREVDYYLQHGRKLPEPSVEEVRKIMTDHMENLYNFYGEYKGILMARKHVSWYTKGQPQGNQFRKIFNSLGTAIQQLNSANEFFETLKIRLGQA